MCACIFWLSKEAGGFDDDIDTKLFPWKIVWVFLGEGLDFFAINNNSVIVVIDIVIVDAVVGIVFKKMS